MPFPRRSASSERRAATRGLHKLGADENEFGRRRGEETRRRRVKAPFSPHHAESIACAGLSNDQSERDGERRRKGLRRDVKPRQQGSHRHFRNSAGNIMTFRLPFYTEHKPPCLDDLPRREHAPLLPSSLIAGLARIAR